MDALQFLRSRNRHDVVLESGLLATIRLPSLKQCIFAGGIPLQIVNEWAKVAESNGKTKSKPKEPSPEEALENARHMLRYQQEVVRSTIQSLGVFLGPEDPALEVTLELVAELQEEDFDEFFAYGSRAKSVPTKASAP